MKTLFSLAVIIAVVFTAVAYGANDPAKVVSTFQSTYASMNDITVSFTQQVAEGNNISLPVSGTMTLSKGNKFRIELEGQTVVSDGATMWTYTPKNNQLLVDAYQYEPMAMTPDKVLSVLPSLYNTQVVGSEKVGELQTSVLQLTAKDKTAPFKNMKVWVDENESLMRKVQVQDGGGNTWTFIISSIKVNTSPSESTFKFSTPRGAQTVDLR